MFNLLNDVCAHMEAVFIFIVEDSNTFDEISKDIWYHTLLIALAFEQTCELICYSKFKYFNISVLVH